MERRWRDWPSDNFKVVLWPKVVNGQMDSSSGRSAVEVRAILSIHGPLAAEVHADTPSTALSDFRLFLNDCGMARVQIDEHCEHYGYDPTRAELSGEVGGFPDGEGGWFNIPAASAVTSDQALAALNYWLPGGGWWPGLAWSDYQTLKPTVAGAFG
jgi:hypothetical protein